MEPERRPGRRPPRRMHRARFDRLVQRALRTLPSRFADRLANVAIVVADAPTTVQLTSVGMRPDEDLLGLYQGVPQPERTSGYGMVLPDKITLFQRAIESSCRNEGEIVAEIRHTIVHELAHHFGIDDERLDELGFD